MNDNKMKTTTEKYINVVAEEYENDIVILMLEKTLKQATYSDKLSNYLLIVSGASLTVFIGNMDSLLKVLGSGTFKFFIISLLLSALLGFIAKVFYLLCSITFSNYLESFNHSKSKMKEFHNFVDSEIQKVKAVDKNIILEYKEPSLNNIMSKYVEFFPDMIKPKIKKEIDDKIEEKKVKKMIVSGHQNTMKKLYMHYGFFLFQLIALLCAFLSTILGIE